MTQKQAKLIARIYISCSGISNEFGTIDLNILSEKDGLKIDKEVVKICTKLWSGEIFDTTDDIVNHVLNSTPCTDK